MQLIRLTFAIILLVLHCSAGPIAHFLPEKKDLGQGDALAQISQSSLLVAHHLQGTVSINTDDALTVIPVTPSFTNSPLLPGTNPADPAHSTVQPSNEQSSTSIPVPSYTPMSQLPTSSTPMTSGYHSTAHQSLETASTSTSALSLTSPIPTPSQSSLTGYGSSAITSSKHRSSHSPSYVSSHVSSGSISTVHTLPSVHPSEQHSTRSSFTPSPPRISGQVSSKPSPPVHTPTTDPNGVAGSPSIPLPFPSSSQTLSDSTPLSYPHGTTNPIKPTNNVPSLLPSLSGSSRHIAQSLPTGSVTIATTDNLPKTPTQTGVSTSLTVGVVGTLPIAVSSSSTPSAPSSPNLETTSDVHAHPVTAGTISTIENTRGSLPTSAGPASGDTVGNSGPSPFHTQETTPATTVNKFPTRSTTLDFAQKTTLSVTGGGPEGDKRTDAPQTTASTISNPVIVIVTPGQSTSWTNTWLHVSDSTPTSSQSSSTATTIRPHGTIPKPKIPTGPTRHHSTTVSEELASYMHSGSSEGVEPVTTIHATSTVMHVVTAAAPRLSTEAEDANIPKGPKATATLNQPEEEASKTPVPPSRKTNPTVETGGPAAATTELEAKPSSQRTGAIDDTLRGLQVVPVTLQGLTVTETKTETTTQIKTTTETETKTLTVYINPTVTMTASLK